MLVSNPIVVGVDFFVTLCSCDALRWERICLSHRVLVDDYPPLFEEQHAFV